MPKKFAARGVAFSLFFSVAILFTSVSAHGDGKFQVTKNKLGDVTLVSLKNYEPAAGTPKLSLEAAQAKAERFIRSNRATLGISNSVELEPREPKQDPIGHSKLSFFQVHRGVPVLGSSVIINLDANGEAHFASVQLSRNLPADVTPKINLVDASRIALDAARESPLAKENELLRVSNSELVLVPMQTAAAYSVPDRLAWMIVIDTPSEIGFNSTFLVDALSGEIFKDYSNQQHIDRRVYDCSKEIGDVSCYLDSMGEEGYYHGRSESQPERGPHNRIELPQYGSLNVDEMHYKGAELHSFVQSQYGINGANRRGYSGLLR